MVWPRTSTGSSMQYNGRMPRTPRLLQRPLSPVVSFPICRLESSCGVVLLHFSCFQASTDPSIVSFWTTDPVYLAMLLHYVSYPARQDFAAAAVTLNLLTDQRRGLGLAIWGFAWVPGILDFVNRQSSTGPQVSCAQVPYYLLVSFESFLCRQKF